jgi:hypothetical protein
MKTPLSQDSLLLFLPVFKNQGSEGTHWRGDEEQNPIARKTLKITNVCAFQGTFWVPYSSVSKVCFFCLTNWWTCGPTSSGINTTWELVRNSNSLPFPKPMVSETLESGVQSSVLISPTGDSDAGQYESPCFESYMVHTLAHHIF